MADRTKPWVGEVKAGRQVICTCAESGNLPYCDGAHASCTEPMRPCVHEFDTDGTVAICMCGKTGKTPFCDGAHSK